MFWGSFLGVKTKKIYGSGLLKIMIFLVCLHWTFCFPDEEMKLAESMSLAVFLSLQQEQQDQVNYSLDRNFQLNFIFALSFLQNIFVTRC